jgi:hypothetical protein
MAETTNQNDHMSHVRAAVAALDRKIAELTKQRDRINDAFFSGAGPTKAVKRPQAEAQGQPSAAPAARQPNGTRAGYVASLVPFLAHGNTVSIADMHAYLQRQPGNEQLKRKSLEATLASELKRPNPRLERVEAGRYRLRGNPAATGTTQNQPQPAAAGASPSA